MNKSFDSTDRGILPASKERIGSRLFLNLIGSGFVLRTITSPMGSRPPMPPKRSGTKATSNSPAGNSTSPQLVNAVLLSSAVSYGLYMLVQRGKVSWPPHDLLASIYTLAGCLALVGPVVLARVDSGERGLGELLWMTGGLLLWVFNATAVARGSWRMEAWATPLGYEAMGMTMLAVLLAGWRCRLGSRSWSWTNVTGWILGLFWVAMAFSTFMPARFPGLASR